MDPSHFPGQVGERPGVGQRRQGPCGRSQGCRQRRCLLKGCERPFWPKCPQARYCSVACQRAAQRWRSQQSSRTYRASDDGRAKRQEQARRHRERRREQRLAQASAAPPGPVSSLLAAAASPASTAAVPVAVVAPASATSATAGAVVASADELAPRVGQRPAVGGDDFLQRRCVRPGCYVWFGVAHDQCSKRFCSVACRLALRRVLDREARYRARRQRWRRQRVPRRRRPLDTS